MGRVKIPYYVVKRGLGFSHMREAAAIVPQMPAGSPFEAFQRYRGTAEWSGKAPRTREEWERAVPSIAPNPPSIESEIAAATDVLLAALCPVPGLARVADIDLSGVKPVPPRRHRAWTQRDITKVLRGAKAAGVEARVMIEDGRITLVPTKPVLADADTDENPWEKFRRG
jgi:hypothetical protein